MTKTNPTIFIVDDEPLLSEMLTDYLKEQYDGFNLRSFPTGEACLQSLDEQPDAVVLDYYLNSCSEWNRHPEGNQEAGQGHTGYHAVEPEKLCHRFANHHVWCHALCDQGAGCI